MPRAAAAFFLLTIALSQPMAAQSPPAAFSTPVVQRTVEAMLPSGASIATLEVAGKRVSVQGAAENNTQVSELMRKLDSSEDFERVELEEINNANGRISFKLHVDIACAAATKASGQSLCGRAPPKTQTVYKCRINGSVSFQHKPCPAGSEF